jgi:hypothetical protein
MMALRRSVRLSGGVVEQDTVSAMDRVHFHQRAIFLVVES